MLWSNLIINYGSILLNKTCNIRGALKPSYFLTIVYFGFLSLPNPGLFLFIFFKQKSYRKNSRIQRDSNSDRRSRRWACWPLDHHHGPSNCLLCVVTLNSNARPHVHSVIILIRHLKQFNAKTLSNSDKAEDSLSTQHVLRATLIAQYY